MCCLNSSLATAADWAQCCSYPGSDYCNVVQKGRTRSTGVMVLRLQLSHHDLWWTRRVRRQLCQYQVCFLEDLLHSHRSFDNGHWGACGGFSARFTSESQEIHGRREGRCTDESQGQSEVCLPHSRSARAYTDVVQAGLKTLASKETRSSRLSGIRGCGSSASRPS